MARPDWAQIAQAKPTPLPAEADAAQWFLHTHVGAHCVGTLGEKRKSGRRESVGGIMVSTYETNVYAACPAVDTNAKKMTETVRTLTRESASRAHDSACVEFDV